MGQEDALRGWVCWLVELLDGERIHRLVQSTHHQGAQALAFPAVSLELFREGGSVVSAPIIHLRVYSQSREKAHFFS